MESIEEAIKTFITQEVMHGSSRMTLDSETALLEEGILDSLGLQQLITFLEQKYGVSVADEDLLPENFENIGAIAELISKQT